MQFKLYKLIGICVLICLIGKLGVCSDIRFGKYTDSRIETPYSTFFNQLKALNEDSSVKEITIRDLLVKLKLPQDCVFGDCAAGDIAMTYMPHFNRISDDDTSGQYIFNKPVIIENCSFEDFGLRFFNCDFKDKLEIKHCSTAIQVEFENVAFEEIEVYAESQFEWLIFKNCEVRNFVKVLNSSISFLDFKENTCTKRENEEKSIINSMRYPSLLIINVDGEYCNISDNQFPLVSPDGVWSGSMSIGQGRWDYIEIFDNQLEGIDLSYLDVSTGVNINDNTFSKGLLLESVGFPEFKTRIDWNQIDNGRLILKSGDRLLSKDSAAIANGGSSFKNLMANYSILYNLYRTRSDLASANACYAEMKLLQSKALKFAYQQNKTFESFFRWQLNAFLSYFTDYGTNPAKAVIKSAWVVLLFAIFYLFFPSDWDVSNRSQLLAKLKDLRSKNREKSFMATLAFVAYSGFIHILNALTLSLNAFTTLGFGDIPTHGAARYVTIVQGFIGWFLLTIFSVSLINQVLG